VPSSTDPRIEDLCSQIKILCSGTFSPETEAKLRKLARELRAAIREHVGMAKSSLRAKKAAIMERDPDQKVSSNAAAHVQQRWIDSEL
jgi:hypothetical protein